VPIEFGASSSPSEHGSEVGVPNERQRTSEVGTYRERLLQPKGAGGQHRAAHAAMPMTARSMGHRRCIGMESAEAGARESSTLSSIPQGANPGG